jgi:hypothetical protein
MRRTLASWSGLLVFLLAASASAAEKRIGLVGGGMWNNLPALAGTTIVGEEITLQPANKRVFGPMGGGIFEFVFGDFGALRFEPKYIRKGADLTVKLKSTGELLSGPVDLDYASFGVMFRSTLFRKKPVQMVLISGLGANYLVKARYQGEDTKDAFNSFELAISSRIGIQRKVGDAGLLGAHFAIESSINRIDKQQPGQAKLRNGGIGFAVEYTASLGGHLH